MNILFSALHLAAFRNFESVICSLAERGHHVCLLADEPETMGGQGLVEALTARHQTVSWQWAPSYEEERWFPLARKLRQSMDYLRYMDLKYQKSPKLYERLAERVPRVLLWLLSVPGINTALGRRLLSQLLGVVEGAMPHSSAMDRFLREQAPDAVLLASITNVRAPQLDHLRSAMSLGIPTGVCVYSWDHLSSKTLIRVVPDRVFVWNNTQKQEAIKIHGLPDDRIVVTGAQCYDRWFSREIGCSSEVFRRDVGLRDDRRFVVYVCSALPLGGENESDFVLEWIRSLRQHADPILREVGILVRPHPERQGEWARTDWSRYPNVVVCGESPMTDSAKADYREALVHSSAVVGLVTSAFLEAAIAGRPVLAITPQLMWRHQGGMRHFNYLLEVEGGLLRVAGNIPEHLTQLSSILVDNRAALIQQRRFLRAFVRPNGLDVPATPVFVEAVEALTTLRVPARNIQLSKIRQGVARVAIALHKAPALRRALMSVRQHREFLAREAKVRANRRQHARQWRRHRVQRAVTRAKARFAKAGERVQKRWKRLTRHGQWLIRRGRLMLALVRTGLRRIREAGGE